MLLTMKQIITCPMHLYRKVLSKSIILGKSNLSLYNTYKMTANLFQLKRIKAQLDEQWAEASDEVKQLYGEEHLSVRFD